MAKTKTNKSNQESQTEDLFVIVDKQTNRRIYIGPGVPKQDAERVASHFGNSAIAVPASAVKNRLYQPETERKEGE